MKCIINFENHFSLSVMPFGRTVRVFGDFFDTFFATPAGEARKSCLRLFGDFGVRWFGSHLRTLALKTENFSKKIGRFSKTRKWIY